MSMKYKVVYQFRWILVLGMIGLIYLCNLILIKLPFVSFEFPEKDLSSGLVTFLLSFFPKFQYEFQIYNLQTVFVWSCGIILGSRLGLTTLSIYIFLGLIGIPIFAGGGGWDYYKESTFGYLISLPLLAFLSGWFNEKNQKFLSVVIPIFATHLIGILYLLFFKQEYLNIAWHLSFSMITYDLIFALALIPVLPVIAFIVNEMVTQEVPVLEHVNEKNR